MKPTRMPLAVPLALLLFASPGCRQDQEPDTAVDPSAESAMAPETDERAHDFDQERSEFVDETQKKIDELDSKIAKLESDLGTLVGEAQETARESLDGLKTQRDKAKSYLERARNASASQWEDIKSRTRRQVSELESDYNSLLEQMRT